MRDADAKLGGRGLAQLGQRMDFQRAYQRGAELLGGRDLPARW